MFAAMLFDAITATLISLPPLRYDYATFIDFIYTLSSRLMSVAAMPDISMAPPDYAFSLRALYAPPPC